MDMAGILDRIDRRYAEIADQTGKKPSDRSISLAAGLSSEVVRNWRRAGREGREPGANAASIQAIASALEVSESWLMTGHGDSRRIASAALPLDLLDADELRELHDYVEFLLSRRKRRETGSGEDQR